VQIGAFLTGLGDLDPIHKSFSAAFWLWSLSPENGWVSTGQDGVPECDPAREPQRHL
jgi:hypothetical protein